MLAQHTSDANISLEEDVDPWQIGSIRVGSEPLHELDSNVSLYIAHIVIPHIDELCGDASIVEVNKRIKYSRGIGHAVLTNRLEGRGELEWETRSLQKARKDPFTGQLIAIASSILVPRNGKYEGIILTETHRRPTDGSPINPKGVMPFQEADLQQFIDLKDVDPSDCIEVTH